MEEINIFMNGTVVTRDDANRVIKDGVVVCQGDSTDREPYRKTTAAEASIFSS